MTKLDEVRRNKLIDQYAKLIARRNATTDRQQQTDVDNRLRVIQERLGLAPAQITREARIIYNDSMR